MSRWCAGTCRWTGMCKTLLHAKLLTPKTVFLTFRFLIPGGLCGVGPMRQCFQVSTGSCGNSAQHKGNVECKCSGARAVIVIRGSSGLAGRIRVDCRVRYQHCGWGSKDGSQRVLGFLAWTRYKNFARYTFVSDGDTIHAFNNV